jgi:hypothetical protein
MCFSGYTSGEGNHGVTKIVKVGNYKGFIGEDGDCFKRPIRGHVRPSKTEDIKSEEDFVWDFGGFRERFWCFCEILGNSGNEVFGVFWVFRVRRRKFSAGKVLPLLD